MYGAIIKQIRKEKGLTQKEIYTGVVSKSFYSDFEAEKYSISIEKFEELLVNLGISYQEFSNYKEDSQKSVAAELAETIDQLYNNGKFTELYAVYTEYAAAPNKALRYLAMKAYLLVLITYNNFYNFSREPFNEIAADLAAQKMWTLDSIRLAKLILLSLGEQKKEEAEKLFERIKKELEKYQTLDAKIFYEEIGDLFFNHIQSLLITNDISAAQKQLAVYKALITPANKLQLMLQLRFIELLLELYVDFPTAITPFEKFIQYTLTFPVSEVHFYEVIGQIHKPKAENYFKRAKKITKIENT